jgi:hypothetical protein
VGSADCLTANPVVQRLTSLPARSPLPRQGARHATTSSAPLRSTGSNLKSQRSRPALTAEVPRTAPNNHSQRPTTDKAAAAVRHRVKCTTCGLRDARPSPSALSARSERWRSGCLSRQIRHRRIACIDTAIDRPVATGNPRRGGSSAPAQRAGPVLPSDQGCAPDGPALLVRAARCAWRVAVVRGPAQTPVCCIRPPLRASRRTDLRHGRRLPWRSGRRIRSPGRHWPVFRAASAATSIRTPRAILVSGTRPGFRPPHRRRSRPPTEDRPGRPKYGSGRTRRTRPGSCSPAGGLGGAPPALIASYRVDRPGLALRRCSRTAG